MPRAAFLFVFVGLFATAWSNDPGLAASPQARPTMRPGRSLPARDAQPSEGTPELTRPLAEREVQRTWVIVNRRAHSHVR
ncbi:MAG: hypothetical protein SH850_15890 [Planctomycetaceae bacterium]|nr:hypothetical protein [Planctomycetaceae bacterium]